MPLASCANSSLGEALKNSLAADPKLKQTAPDGNLATLTGTQPTMPANAGGSAKLPADFPAEIPRYPGAVLAEVMLIDQGLTTRWMTQDGSDLVLAFYKQQFQTANWKLDGMPLSSQQGTLIARQATPPQPALEVTVSTGTAATGTEFTIQYTREQGLASVPNATNPPATTPSPGAITPSPSPVVSPSVLPTATPAEQRVFLGLEGNSDGSPIATAIAAPGITQPNPYTDLGQAPKELQPLISDLAQLGILSPTFNDGKTKATEALFLPNKPVSRREYARWLFLGNNRLYGDRPAQQIRPALTTAQPVFRDIPATDPDFPAIQGLAEAGIIPSALSGDLTTTTFRPDAQLSRETLLLWKVPMDTRQPLPTAAADAVKQTWGFQDANQIDPKAQRAILADYQNADQSNIRRVFGYTTLFQPKKAVTRAEAAATLGHLGYQGDGVSVQAVLKRQ